MNNEIVATVVYIVLAFLLIGIAMLVFAYYARKKVLETKLQQKQAEIDYEKSLNQATILSQEAERTRIAKELHDGVNAQVNLVSLQAGILKDMQLTDLEKEELLDKLIAQCGSITESIRHVIHDLLPPVLEKFGLARAVEELCYELNATGRVCATFNCDVEIGEIENMHSLYVYRILQELTKNSIVHGLATHIDIWFGVDSHGFKCTYKDDGKGFEMATALEKTGLGLKNIQSRLKYLNSSLSVEKNNPQGVIIYFNF